MPSSEKVSEAALKTKFALAIVALPAVACTFVYPTDGLVASGGVGDEGDASSDAGESVVVVLDSSVDASTSDVRADVAAGPYCKSLTAAPTFCCDYDEGALGDCFNVRVASGGTARIDPASAVSVPNALLAGISGSVNYAYVYRSFSAQADMALTLDAKLETLPPGEAPLVAQLDLFNNSDPAWKSVRLLAGVGHGAIEVHRLVSGVEKLEYFNYTTADVVLGDWAHYDLRVVITPAPQIVLEINGKVVVTQAPLGAWKAAPVLLSLGLVWAPQSGPDWRVRLDNITFDVH